MSSYLSVIFLWTSSTLSDLRVWASHDGCQGECREVLFGSWNFGRHWPFPQIDAETTAPTFCNQLARAPRETSQWVHWLTETTINCSHQNFVSDSGKRTGSTILPNATNVMRDRLAYEYDFYAFIRVRFHAQLRESKILRAIKRWVT